MHSRCMATETSSFRDSWPKKSVTGAELLEIYRKHGPFFSEEALRAIEKLKVEDHPPEDKWERT
jgi:hypothetical protein